MALKSKMIKTIFLLKFEKILKLLCLKVYNVRNYSWAKNSTYKSFLLKSFYYKTNYL